MKFKKIKTNKKIRNKTNKYLFYLLTIIVLSLSVGYSAINSEVTISGEANFRVLEELRVTDVRLYETTHNGEESYRPKFTKDTLTLGVDLKEVESTVTYKMELTNYGTVAQRVSSISQRSNSNENATYELIGYSANTLIYPGETAEIYITIKYKTNVSILPEVTTVDLILGTECVTPEGTLATNFRGNLSASSIESIEFLPSLQVGEDAIGYWDASYNHDNMVVAWYTDTDSDNLYELYLGGNGKIYAPVNINSLFKNFNNVTSISFGNYFNTTNVTNMNALFYGCSNLESILFGQNFDTPNVTNMLNMFNGCSKLTSLDLSTFDTRNVTVMNSSTYGNGMFWNCYSLTSITFGQNFDTSNISIMSYMFYNCSKLTSLNLNNWNTENVTNMTGMFYNCSKLETLNLSGWDTSKVTKMSSESGLGDGMFYKCSSLISLNLSSFDTTNVTNMKALFYGCSNLESILFGQNFDTPNVTNMLNMFNGCSKLTSLDLSTFDTRNVTVMNSSTYGNGMFWNCYSLTSITFGQNFDTSNISIMSYMFYNCSKLTSLNLNNWNTENVTNMTGMFYNCSKLETLNLSGWDTSKVTKMSSESGLGDGMFYKCSSLVNLDIRNFDFTNVINYNRIFSDVPISVNIIVKSNTERDWIHNNISSRYTNIKTVAELTPA